MIRITSTIMIRRPERILYYLPVITDEIEQCIMDGICPPELLPYRYAYGTYDEAGLFYLPTNLQKETGMQRVVGIEYRKDDNSLNVPDTLAHVVLPACDIVIQDISHEDALNKGLLTEIIHQVKDAPNSKDERYHYVSDGIISTFTSKDKLRIMYQIELTNPPRRFGYQHLADYTKEELYRRAFHEPITDYHNWAWLWESLYTYHLEGIKDYAFVHFDIKDFKMVNELYNHQVGNHLLQRVTQNIEAHRDWIYYGARCDNDNFALMIRDMPDDEIRTKLLSFFNELSPLKEDPTYRVYFRCGVVSMRYAMNTGDIVADCAKLAQSLGTGINVTEINFYTNEMHENVLWGKQLKAYLDTAITSNEFLVHLQPKMDIVSEKICGAEALVRWNYKHQGLMPPYRFIPHFEADDSIIKVDEVVLHNVCAKLKEWKEKGYALYPISVNLSRKHVEQENLAEHLSEIVDSYGVEHSLIEFELTESVAYDNQKYMVSVMHELKNKGFSISMDDFGTGYSSFSLLKEMHLDTLKIDKSFVDLIAANHDLNKNQIILRHIIAMSKELGINCIAEGVEEYAQVAALRELGCETIQGYYYSKPISIDDFETNYMHYLHTNK